MIGRAFCWLDISHLYQDEKEKRELAERREMEDWWFEKNKTKSYNTVLFASHKIKTQTRQFNRNCTENVKFL